ncbi:MAG: hypothetical protein KatS3mg038_3357 [Candidatus Kapaibacterium sp.]|nr:MAG: hypothetical protein KatS3mg038_3357 [Candidatus Kapabacteria bacterium]
MKAAPVSEYYVSAYLTENQKPPGKTMDGRDLFGAAVKRPRQELQNELRKAGYRPPGGN